MKILHYIPGLDHSSGGTSVYMQLLSAELGKLVDLHIVSHTSLRPVEMKNCQVHYISASILGGMKREWKKIICCVKPDVIHIHCCWIPQCALAQRWAQQMGYKVVLTPHGMLEPWIIRRHYLTRKLPALWLYQRRAVKNADCLHATSVSEKEHLLALGYNKYIALIASGIDVEQAVMKQSWKRSRKILFLSRIHAKKGIEFLLDAVAALRGRLEGYTVFIAGEGESSYLEQLRQRVKKLSIDHMVEFCGGVYGYRKWKLFQEADVFVLPTYSENFGNVVAEALACGTPVITTIGTPWKELQEKHCGWYTEIGTQALINALDAFLKLPETDLETMGRNGRRLVEEEYSSRRMAKEICELYKSIITLTRNCCRSLKKTGDLSTTSIARTKRVNSLSWRCKTRNMSTFANGRCFTSLRQ